MLTSTIAAGCGPGVTTSARSYGARRVRPRYSGVVLAPWPTRVADATRATVLDAVEADDRDVLGDPQAPAHQGPDRSPGQLVGEAEAEAVPNISVWYRYR
jgi:hypothetical protein